MNSDGLVHFCNNEALVPGGDLPLCWKLMRFNRFFEINRTPPGSFCKGVHTNRGDQQEVELISQSYVAVTKKVLWKTRGYWMQPIYRFLSCVTDLNLCPCLAVFATSLYCTACPRKLYAADGSSARFLFALLFNLSRSLYFSIFFSRHFYLFAIL